MEEGRAVLLVFWVDGDWSFPMEDSRLLPFPATMGEAAVMGLAQDRAQ